MLTRPTSTSSVTAYCEQGAVRTFPASTFRAGALAMADGVLVDAVGLPALADPSTIVPVSSTFLPTCGWSAVGLAMSR